MFKTEIAEMENKVKELEKEWDSLDSQAQPERQIEIAHKIFELEKGIEGAKALIEFTKVKKI